MIEVCYDTSKGLFVFERTESFRSQRTFVSVISVRIYDLQGNDSVCLPRATLALVAS